MSASPAVRVLTAADSEGVARILGASFGWAMPHLATLHTTEENLWFVRERLFPADEIWGAFVDDALVGYVATRPQWIDHLYVLPESTLRGIGTALLDLVKTRERRISLWTFQSNRRACAFYEARGFQETSRTHGTGNAEREPDVLYCWRPE